MKRHKLHTWAWIGALVVALTVAGLIAQFIAVFFRLDILMASAMFQALMLVTVILFARSDGHGTDSLGLRFEWQSGDWQAVAILVAIQYGGSMLTAALTADHIDVDNMNASTLLEAFVGLEPAHFFVIAASVTILVGFTEELLFRGYLLSRLEAAGVPTSGAVLLSASLFGLVHWSGYGAILSASKALWFGLPSALYFARQRKLLPIVVAHTTINFLGFLSVYAIGQFGL